MRCNDVITNVMAFNEEFRIIYLFAADLLNAELWSKSASSVEGGT